jgi:hypothetical protein
VHGNCIAGSAVWEGAKGASLYSRDATLLLCISDGKWDGPAPSHLLGGLLYHPAASSARTTRRQACRDRNGAESSVHIK